MNWKGRISIAAASSVNIWGAKSVAFFLGHAVNHATRIFIYTVYTHIVYIYRVCICMCCNAELTSCFIMSPLTERTGTHWGHPQQTSNKGLHKGQHRIFSHTAEKKRGPTFCLHPPFPTHIQSSERADVGGYCCHELLSLSPFSLSLLHQMPLHFLCVLCFPLMWLLMVAQSSSSSHRISVLGYIYSPHRCFIITANHKSIRPHLIFLSLQVNKGIVSDREACKAGSLGDFMS